MRADAILRDRQFSERAVVGQSKPVSCFEKGVCEP